MREKLFQLFLGINKISTDSRSIEPGSIYFALKGPRFDGNKYIEEALKKGAVYAISDDPSQPENGKIIQVENVLQALQCLARDYRDTFQIPVIGITGSNGKTTTKELIYSILATEKKVHVTTGNLNNHIGVPLTLLSMPADTEIAVIEMGANHVGDNAELCHIFNPTAGLITSIGKEHLEGFGSIEGVIQGNIELYEFLKNNKGLIWVNGDDAILMSLSDNMPRRIVYGTQDNADVHAYINQLNPSINFEMDGIKLESVLFGKYNFDNIMAAVAIAKFTSIDITNIRNGVKNYIPSNHRSQWIEINGNKILVDCYNANPTSMELAIENFMLEMDNTMHKLLIVGDMFEMGEHEFKEHERIAEKVRQYNQVEVILCGNAFYKQRKNDGLLYFHNTDSLRNYLMKKKYINYKILIKASRGMKFEQLLEVL